MTIAGAPAAVAGLQRLAHHVGVAGAVEGVVRAAVGQRDEMRDDVALDRLRVDEVGHAEAAAPLLAVGVDVDADDHARPRQPRALEHVEPDAAQPEHDHVVAGLDLGGVDHRADARGDAAADVAAVSNGASSRIFATAISGSTVKLEKVEQPM